MKSWLLRVKVYQLLQNITPIITLKSSLPYWNSMVSVGITSVLSNYIRTCKWVPLKTPGCEIINLQYKQPHSAHSVRMCRQQVCIDAFRAQKCPNMPFNIMSIFLLVTKVAHYVHLHPVAAQAVSKYLTVQLKCSDIDRYNERKKERKNIFSQYYYC